MSIPLSDAIFGTAGKSVYGSKPIVPEFTPTDTTKEEQLAISGNLKSFKQASVLTGKENVFNQQQLQSMLAAAIPQYQALVAAGSARTSDLLNNQSFADMLAGKIPGDVSAAVQNSAAARSVGGGYSGSQFSGNLLARDLGLTSLDLISRGAQLTINAIGSAEKWMADSKALAVPAQHDVASMFVSPAMRIANTQQNNQNQWQRDWIAAQVAAAPDPVERGNFDTEMGLAGMALSIYSGGAGYTNYNKNPGGAPAGGGSLGGGGGGWNMGGGGQTQMYGGSTWGGANDSYMPQYDARSNIDYGSGNTFNGFSNFGQ